MVDKFTRLTFKILKVLGLEYVMLDSKSHTKEDGPYTYMNELIFRNIPARLYISDMGPISQGRIEIETYVAHIRTPITEGISYSGVESYIDIISKIFDKHISFPRNRKSYIDNSAEYIVDELLAYTDEEFKLYISLL